MRRLIALCLTALLVAVGLVLPGAGIVNAAPPAPTLILPGNGAVVPGTSVNFEWTPVDGAVDYKLIVNKTNNLYATGRKTDVRLGNVTSYVDAGYPADGAVYYWWVIAYDGSGTNSNYTQVIANGKSFVIQPTYAIVAITAPSAIAFGQFTMGWNLRTSGTAGTVTVTPGISGDTKWTVTAKCNKYMGTATSTLLSTPLLIGKGWSTWHIGDGSDEWVVAGGEETHCIGFLTYSGTTATGSLPFYAYQFIADADITTTGGVYTNTITFTATCDP